MAKTRAAAVHAAPELDASALSQPLRFMGEGSARVISLEGLIKSLEKNHMAYVRLDNEFFEGLPPADREAAISINPKGGRTEKGILWNSDGLPSLILLREAGASMGAKVLDLGSGDGGFDVYAAKNLRVNVTGIEFNETLHRLSEAKLRWFESRGHLDSGLVAFKQGDFLKHDISSYDILYYFQYGTKDPEALENHILKGMRPGARLAVYHYDSIGGYEFPKIRREFKMELISIKYPSDTRPIPAGAIFTMPPE